MAYIQIKSLHALKSNFDSLVIAYDNKGDLDRITYKNETIHQPMTKKLGNILKVTGRVDSEGWLWPNWAFIELERNVSDDGSIFYLPKKSALIKGDCVIIRDGSAIHGSMGIVDKVVDESVYVFVPGFGMEKFHIRSIEKFIYESV